MAPVFDASKLWRKLNTTYGGTEDRTGKHPSIIFEVQDKAPVIVRQQHSSRGDLPDHIARQTAHNLGVTVRELKQIEVCTFGRQRLHERLLEAER